ncbi:hypothetical protein J5N97_018505 [Dioscorea zingiberensis]|uniref:GATA transcription factor n=1 Tax=Dioscorea zingiberensis TaxID=325984 RepID=A0A9D5HBI3_9LILI|nr:hypothetical protein J5N97_018505 [Dioscorea zingiberensis]
MAPGWEMGMGSAAASGGPMHDTQTTYLYQRMDHVLDFSNHDEFFPSSSSGVESHGLLHPPEPSAPFAMNESSPSNHFSFSNDLYIPYCEEEAELEWLSRFVDDSFSDVPYHHVPPVSSSTEQQGERSTPAPISLSSPSTTSTSSSSSELAMAEDKAGNAEKSSSSTGRGLGGKKGGAGVGVRRCTHCASEKTPQWRTGPMGPKTLCNACGVRYKSGRLVPEYRPAASPTFVLTQHSNSHRKVLELRRQKELMLAAATAAGARPEFLLP